MKVLKSNSGLPVLFRHLESPLVSFRFFVKCGSLHEEKKEQGLCHALEHMYFAGTTLRDWDKIQSDYRTLGAYSNASTGFHYTEYEVLVPAENFETALEITTDLLNNSTFPEERWEKVERRAVINELLGFENDSNWVLQDLTLADLLGSKYHNPIGSADVIEKSNIKKLLNFSQKYYNQENVVLSVAGGVSETRVLKAINKYPIIGKGKIEKRPPFSFKLNYKERHLLISGATTQPLITMVNPLSPLKSQAEFYECQIAVELLSDLLMAEIRERRGLAYHIGANLGLDIPEVPIIHITTSAESVDNLDNTIREIKSALRRMVKNPPSEEKIHQAKMDLYRYCLLAESNPQEVSMRIGDMFLLGWKNDLLEDPKKFLKSLNSNKVKKKFEEICSGRFKLTTLVGE